MCRLSTLFTDYLLSLFPRLSCNNLYLIWHYLSRARCSACQATIGKIGILGGMGIEQDRSYCIYVEYVGAVCMRNNNEVKKRKRGESL
jgi:hypothetical protein